MSTLPARGSDQMATGIATTVSHGSPHDPCPLCGSSDARVVVTLAYDDIWAALERDWGVSLSEDVRHRHAPVTATTLVECVACGLQFFRPQLPGDDAFYRELMSQ